ncbi:MAG: hypothetical protein IKU39_04880 [Lachnospiraceae bacterium]|nr:hypothetical protein [Lachnospiraceae bacterium]
MRKERFIRRLKLLNPKNLAREVHVYGYHFSWKTHLLVLMMTLFAMSMLGFLFKIPPFYFSCVIGCVCIMLPVFILDMYKGMYEQKRFADAVTYAEQILYSFQKNGKVVSALKETKGVFEEGRMQWTLEDAIAYLEEGNSSSGDSILKEALALIEKQYDCNKIHMVHKLLINCEELGGDAEQSILLVLNDIELWKRREYTLWAGKKVQNRDNLISIVVAVILCLTALYVMDAMGMLLPDIGTVALFELEVIQISSFLFLLFLLYVFSKSQKSLTKNWLQAESLYSESYILASYDRVMQFDEQKNRWKKIAGGFPYYLAKRDINRELYYTLPQWLMQIALLLQNNNVQVSLMKSMEDAPPVLRKELEKLRERLEDNPKELQSYTEFCKRFDVPEIQSCMKMLHAISESGTGNAQIQINNLLQRVHEMQNIAEDIRVKEEAFYMKLLFSYPVLAATFKLLVDMTIGILFIFQLLGRVGGM